MLAVLASLLLAGTVAVSAEIRILYQNDLSFNASTPAILLSDAVAGTDAASACGMYSEALLGTVTSDIQDQLNYLVFRGALSNSSRLYVGGGSGGSSSGNATVRRRQVRFDKRQQQQNSSCTAYTVGTQATASVDCSTSLPVLCSNSASPYTTNTTVQQSQQVPIGDSSASFVGYRDARSFRFEGIPFAQPPVGDLRFQAAQPYNGSYSNFTATQYAPVCLQSGFSVEGYSNGQTESEDCLYLNVYTPAIPAESGNSTALPVAFWIYGGAFVSGGSSLSLYDGGNMASRGDVVVVTINYRLGILGNMASSSLNGSQGITDQIQGLKWVQKHIAAFGGDPSRVTIYGESAGAQSVVALLSSTPAKGLFAAAIGESAPWSPPFVNREVYTGAIYPALLNSTNCTTSSDSASQLSCLRNLPASTFYLANVNAAVTAASEVAQLNYSMAGPLDSAVEPLLPVVGTGVVDALFIDQIRDGSLPSAGLPIMLGNMANEGILFTSQIPQLKGLPALPFVLDQVVKQSFDPSTAAAIINNTDLFPFNTSDPDALRNLAGNLVTLINWQCPLQQVLTTAYEKKTFSSLYSYRMDKGILVTANATGELPCTPNNPSGIDNVCHSEDLVEVFGSSNVVGLPYGSTPVGNNDLQYNQYVVDVWASFFRTFDPKLKAGYQQARGRSYANSLAWSQAAPFDAFNPNSTSALQLINAPPTESGLVYVPQCQVLQNAGFLYDKIQA